MSLIQEALRRQQQDRSAADAQQPPSGDAQPPPDPPIPPPLSDRGGGGPPEAQDEEARSQDEEPVSRAWASLVATLFVLLAVVAALVWGLVFAYQKAKAHSPEGVGSVLAGLSREQDVDTQTAGGTSGVAPNAETAGFAPSNTAGTLAAGPSEVTAEATTNKGTGQQAEPETTGNGIGVSLVKRLTRQGERAATPTIEEQPDEEEAPPEELPTYWPRIMVSGLIGNGAGGAAILNGEIITVGESILGVTVKGVEAKAVRLAYKGEERTIHVGQATD